MSPRRAEQAFFQLLHGLERRIIQSAISHRGKLPNIESSLRIKFYAHSSSQGQADTEILYKASSHVQGDYSNPFLTYTTTSMPDCNLSSASGPPHHFPSDYLTSQMRIRMPQLIFVPSTCFALSKLPTLSNSQEHLAPPPFAP